MTLNNRHRINPYSMSLLHLHICGTIQYGYGKCDTIQYGYRECGTIQYVYSKVYRLGGETDSVIR